MIPDGTNEKFPVDSNTPPGNPLLFTLLRDVRITSYCIAPPKLANVPISSFVTIVARHDHENRKLLELSKK